MVLKEKAQGLLYPEGHPIIELEKGNLTKPLFGWNEWIQVSVIQFGIPSDSATWIKNDLLALPTEVEPSQGFLRVGTQAYETFNYNEINSLEPEIPQSVMPVIYSVSQMTIMSGWTTLIAKTFQLSR